MSKRQPNRSHSVIEELPAEIREQIEDWMVGNATKGVPRLRYWQIRDELAEMGIEVSISQIGRHAKKVLPTPAISQAAIATAKAIAKVLLPDGTEVEQATVALANSLILELLADADLEQIKTAGDFAKVLGSLSRLQSSSVMRDKWETEKRKKIDAAVEELEKRIQDVLEGKPDLMKAILEAVDEAKQQMTEKSA